MGGFCRRSRRRFRRIRHLGRVGPCFVTTGAQPVPIPPELAPVDVETLRCGTGLEEHAFRVAGECFEAVMGIEIGRPFIDRINHQKSAASRFHDSQHGFDRGDEELGALALPLALH